MIIQRQTKFIYACYYSYFIFRIKVLCMSLEKKILRALVDNALQLNNTACSILAAKELMHSWLSAVFYRNKASLP